MAGPEDYQRLVVVGALLLLALFLARLLHSVVVALLLLVSV